MSPREQTAEPGQSSALHSGRLDRRSRVFGLIVSFWPPLVTRLRRVPRWVGVVVLATSLVVGYAGYRSFRTEQLAAPVRRAFAEARFEEAREPLRQWIEARPSSGEAQYYRAWLALVDDRPNETATAFRRAADLGYDRRSLEIIRAIYQARAHQVQAAEPILLKAFEEQREPRAEVARELARIFLETYRLTQAAPAIERYRELRPADPQPYLWRIEIASRMSDPPAVLIRNYRAALERSPDLEKARIGLAEQLVKDQRFDEAVREYRRYLADHPKDAGAMVGLGRCALRQGNIEAAVRAFEDALAVAPQHPEALQEVAQLDIRFGRLDRACQRLETLTRAEPFRHEYHYAYAQALKLAGRDAEARRESKTAAQLRDEEDRMLRVRSKILLDPKDLNSRLEVARWMLGHGQDREGLKWAHEILGTDPHHVPTHELLAGYYEKQRNAGLANYHRMMADRGRIPD